MHAHKVKDETFVVMNGNVILEHIDARGHKHEEILGYGDTRHIPTGMYHRFGSVAGATILEVSTQHSDADVIRLEASSEIP
jgi:mannose-6-phosphate isomerase